VCFELFVCGSFRSRRTHTAIRKNGLLPANTADLPLLVNVKHIVLRDCIVITRSVVDPAREVAARPGLEGVRA